jgi:hypothetical protein
MSSGNVVRRAVFPAFDRSPFEHHKPEQTAKRGVASVLRGLLGTKRESLIFKGFRKYRTQHGIFEKNEVETAGNPLFSGLSAGALGEIRTPDPRNRNPMLVKRKAKVL